MSKQAVEQLLEMAAKNTALQQQLDAAGGFAEVVQIGTERGYQFSEEDARVFLRERGISIDGSADGELSEEALEAIAGGQNGLFGGYYRPTPKGW
jgi:predicted ribosomally synthesized peptide with nif11-like leader